VVLKHFPLSKENDFESEKLAQYKEPQKEVAHHHRLSLMLFVVAAKRMEGKKISKNRIRIYTKLTSMLKGTFL